MAVVPVVVVAPVVLVDGVVVLVPEADWLSKRAKSRNGLKFRLVALLMLDTTNTPFSRNWRTAHCPESYKNPSKFWLLFCEERSEESESFEFWLLLPEAESKEDRSADPWLSFSKARNCDNESLDPASLSDVEKSDARSLDP